MPQIEQYIDQNIISWLLLTSGLIILIGVLYLVFIQRRMIHQYRGQITDEVAAANEIFIQNQHEMLTMLSRLEGHIDNTQKRIFDSLSQDRERQLAATAALRVELEKRFADSSLSLNNNLQEFKHKIVERFEQLKGITESSQRELKQAVIGQLKQFGDQQSAAVLQEQSQTRELIDLKIRNGLLDLRKDLDRSIEQQNLTVANSIKELTESTDNRLKEISGQVERRLAEGFDKTNQTFTDVLKRLALIDDAQKKITELSGNVVSLQEVLNDKRSRGAFGEVQLNALISNVIPKRHYQIQHKLSNDKVADCVLLLPQPTGKIAIDAKFPLESYRRMTDVHCAEADRQLASKQFARDIKKHIDDIADKYVLPPETAEGAVMFIPAESVFAEIHSHFPELVEMAHRRKVWLVSPTTLMAILTTAAAVIKDEATREQVHIIQEHLNALGKDFTRFQDRMDKLSRHISQVSKDVEQVHVSARKITSRFDKIEKVEMSKEMVDDESLLETRFLLSESNLEISDR
ncbi:DNA recombination protein RmuC [Aliikangiella marina]|uniref:DNA recombination protein RmuC n=1 Tax=Aliikangiella marina TaxID=1712262 RepID=A0A545TDD1_9GAMM|nr:DNA recombination protein RmuC [Aliikangiella marina]TQV75225.1 DNA recombination protein RmuC [Aliikangiella marina]